MNPRALLAEGVATFCLILAGTGSIVVNEISRGQITTLGIGLVFGLIVFAMIAALGPLSGAHMNPAVTIAFYANGQFPGHRVVAYVVAQSLGAVTASAVLHFLFFNQANSLGMTHPSGSALQSLGMEFVLSFILMLVILGVSHDAQEKGLMTGLVVGGTVALAAIFGGPISGASMNPIRSWAPALIMGDWSHQWIYGVGPLSGCLSAVGIHRLIRS